MPEQKDSRGVAQTGALKRSSASNPFYGGARNNFPSLDRALGSLTNDRDSDTTTATNASPSDSLDLSIDVRAALHEHLRLIAKFGIDNDAVHSPSDDLSRRGTASSTSPPPAPQKEEEQAVAATATPVAQTEVLSSNTLDEEWEKLLDGQQPDFSFQSTSDLPTFDRYQVLSSTTDDIEVAVVEMTSIEPDDHPDDFFNSSKVWQLMTPEKNRGRTQAVTNRRDEEVDDDEFDDRDEESQEGNTPESACLLDDTANQRRVDKPSSSPSPSSSKSSSPGQAIVPEDLSLDAAKEIAAKAAAITLEYERNPHLVASVAIGDFHSDDALCNSLLATSIHEDAPLITSPFMQAPAHKDIDVEGSFADWSVQSVEHSCVVPSAVTPIRPLPPLSPVHSTLRNSPSSSRQGTSSSSSSGNNHKTPRGSPRSSTSSSSFRRWRAPNAWPQQSVPEFGVRDEMIASPIQSQSSSPESIHGSPFTNKVLFVDDQEPDFAGARSPLSPSAKLAAQTAARLLQNQPPSLRPRSSIRKNLWPSDSILRLQSTESADSSTDGIAGEKSFPDPSKTADNSKVQEAVKRPVLHGQERKDCSSSAPLVSVDTMTTACSHLSSDAFPKHRDCGSPMTTRSADAVVMDRRIYRTVVPRRIFFPEDGRRYQHDSFDAPPNFAHSF